MIELIHKPQNFTLKSDGSSIYSELEGLPIEVIDEDYYGFRVRDPLFDPLAGGRVHILLKGGEYFTFNITGIDVSAINNLKDAQTNLLDAVPEQYKCKFQFQWKRFMNSKGLVREYSLVCYEFLPTLYELMKKKVVTIMADDNLRVPYFRISD